MTTKQIVNLLKAGDNTSCINGRKNIDPVTGATLKAMASGCQYSGVATEVRGRTRGSGRTTMAAELQARAQAYLASKKPFLGLKVKTAPDKTKLIVTKITKRGPADLAGVREAGPIFEIKGQTVSTVEEFNRIVDGQTVSTVEEFNRIVDDVRIGDVLDFRIGDSEVVKVLVGMEKESARALASLLRIAAGNIQAGDETMKQLEYTASNGVSVAKAPARRSLQRTRCRGAAREAEGHRTQSAHTFSSTSERRGGVALAAAAQGDTTRHQEHPSRMPADAHLDI
eukprot:g19983.t1